MEDEKLIAALQRADEAYQKAKSKVTLHTYQDAVDWIEFCLDPKRKFEEDGIWFENGIRFGPPSRKYGKD